MYADPITVGVGACRLYTLPILLAYSSEHLLKFKTALFLDGILAILPSKSWNLT